MKKIFWKSSRIEDSLKDFQEKKISKRYFYQEDLEKFRTVFFPEELQRPFSSKAKHPPDGLLFQKPSKGIISRRHPKVIKTAEGLLSYKTSISFFLKDFHKIIFPGRPTEDLLFSKASRESQRTFINSSFLEDFRQILFYRSRPKGLLS